MLNVLVFLLCAYGVCNILIYSSGPFRLFERIRDYGDNTLPSNLAEMLHCMICLPTWIGLIFSTLNIFVFPEVMFTPIYSIIGDTSYAWFIIPMDGAICSGGVWLIHTLQELFEKED